MDVALAAVSLVPGLAVGSFLNVVAARVPTGRSIVHPGSACPSCGASLAWYDNIPLLSYVLLRGKCRHCQARISLRYPVVEATTAVLIAGCFLKFGWSADALIGSFFCAALVAVSATDLERRVIPNLVVLPAAAVVLVANTLVHPSVEWVAAGLGAGAFLLLPSLVYLFRIFKRHTFVKSLETRAGPES